MQKKDSNHFVLNNGKIIYACDLRLGMSEELTLSYGYDGMFYPLRDAGTDEEYGDYTPQEAVEISDYMINLWQKFKSAQQGRAVDAPQVGA